MSDNPAGTGGGLFTALKNITATLLAGGKTRLELLGNEIEEEKQRALQLFVFAQAMLFCCGVGLLLAIALLTAVFWDNRVLVLGATSAFFLVFAGIFYTLVTRATQRPERVFAASIAELQEDLRQLKAALGHESRPE
jgi:uncharacterized membrane protein YqjE